MFCADGDSTSEKQTAELLRGMLEVELVPAPCSFLALSVVNSGSGHSAGPTQLQQINIWLSPV